MFNNIIPERYQLKDCYKGYTEAQDKVIPPQITFNKAFANFKKAFPKADTKLIEQIRKPGFYAYDFRSNGLNTHGKGATLEQAKASAIMEFMERYTWLGFEYKNYPGYIFTSFNDLNKKFDLSDIERLLYVPFTEDPENFMEKIKKIPAHWIECFCITDNDFSYYPISFFNNFAASNGLASGNSIEEAVFQGLCECVERHNIDYWMDNLTEETQLIIDNSTIKNKLLANLIDLLAKDNVDMYIFQTSKPCEIPTFAACGIDRKPVKKVVEIGYGFGTHSDPEKSILRAVTEYIQARAGFLKNDRVPEFFQLKKGQWQFALQMDIRSVIEKSKYISINDVRSFANHNIKLEITSMVEHLKEMGSKAYFVNKTRSDIKIPVVRTFVTGFTQGSKMTSINSSEQYLYGNLLYQGKLIDEVEKYYYENFHKLVESMVPIEDLLPLMLKPEHLKIAEKIDLTEVLTPEKMPLEKIFKDNFQDIFDTRKIEPPDNAFEINPELFNELAKEI